MMKKALILQARQSDLPEFLLSKGIDLKREGARYKSREHDSLVFTANSYYWNATGETGNAVDYLTKHMGYTFKDAVLALTNEHKKTPSVTTTTTESVYTKSSLNRAFAYLNKTRCISPYIIQNLADNDNLFIDEHNNIAFPMRDESLNVVGYELQGTLSNRRFKGVSANAGYGYGFSLKIGDKAPTRLFAFESVIDLLSFREIYESRLKDGDLLLSLAGLKESTLKHYMDLHNPSNTFICVDNDEAGKKFKDSLKTQSIAFTEVLSKAKDWNEDLRDRKKKSGQ